MWLSLPIVAVFAWEKKTGMNLFANLGGVPARTIIRDGELRCQGPFPHPILAGYFWASLLPVFLSRWWKSAAAKPLVIASLVAGSGIVILSSATTPLLGGIAGIGVMSLYAIRSYMRPLRWAALGVLASLHIVMNAPVWHLLGRVNVVTGSTGYHRYRLIDAAIAHFGEWFLIGTESTGHWGRQMFDLTNQYVREGVKGGLLGLVLFCAILAYGFQGVGRSWRRAPRFQTRMLIWSLGCFLFANAVMFLAISFSYSRQNLVPWYFVLAALATLAPAPARRSVRRRATTSERRAPAARPGAPDPSPAR